MALLQGFQASNSQNAWGLGDAGVCCDDASWRDDEIYGLLSWKGRVCELKRKCVSMCMCVCCNDASQRDDEIYGFLSWKGRVCE